MSRSGRRACRKARGSRSQWDSDQPESRSSLEPQPQAIVPRLIEDLQLARDMISGGWKVPAEGRLRLMSRLVAIADDPATPPAFRLGAINALTRIDEHLLKLKIAEQAENSQAAHPVQAALQLLANMAQDCSHTNINTNESGR